MDAMNAEPNVGLGQRRDPLVDAAVSEAIQTNREPRNLNEVNFQRRRGRRTTMT
jgi:hypothetical protein